MTKPLADNDVKWVVNDYGELGVCVQGQYFFLYKGESMEYGKYSDTSLDGIATHDDDNTPIMVREVAKREFGEVCWPVEWVQAGRRPEGRYNSFDKYQGEWKPLPAAIKKSVKFES